MPELGIKVPYKPGTCAILCGGDLDHLDRDFKGTRYFIIATNHESSRQYALRQMGDPGPGPFRPPRTRVTRRRAEINAVRQTRRQALTLTS